MVQNSQQRRKSSFELLLSLLVWSIGFSLTTTYLVVYLGDRKAGPTRIIRLLG